MALIVTWVSAETAARILYLSLDAISELCEKGALRARRASKAAPWQIDYGSVIDYCNAHPVRDSKSK